MDEITMLRRLITIKRAVDCNLDEIIRREGGIQVIYMNIKAMLNESE